MHPRPVSRIRTRWFAALLAAGLVAVGPALRQPHPARAADLLDGEFASIDLGRTLIQPKRLPSVQELRALVRKPEISTVLMFKLFTSGDNHHLPVFSSNGLSLAFQRSDVRARSSKLLMYSTLSQPEPTMLTDDPAAYDYMFRWGVNGPGSFSFVRIDPGKSATRIFTSTGGDPHQRVAGDKRRRFPALYRRTDGIWRLVYEEEGRLMQEAFTLDRPLHEPLLIAHATSPRWSRDGSRLLMARQRGNGGQTSGYEMVVWNLRTEEDLPLAVSGDEIVRSPTWSPDEKAAAFYVRQSGEGKPWQIRVCPVTQEGPGATFGGDVVVNPDFESQGPAWEPSGRRVWFFSHENSREAYYPLTAAEVDTGRLATVDYPKCCTTPHDLAVNPTNLVPEIAFVAHDGLPKDLFIVFLNHY